MNRLLTTITLLCFAVVSFAEIYLCAEVNAVPMDRKQRVTVEGESE